MRRASWRPGTVAVVLLAMMTACGCIKSALLNGQIKGTREGSAAIDTLSDFEVARTVAYAGLGQFEGMHELAPDNEDQGSAGFWSFSAPLDNMHAMQSESMYRPSAAEFPHDNPRVDRGALWVGSALCSPTPTPTPAAAPIEDTPPAPCSDDDPIANFVRAVTEVALIYGPAETAAHIESLFHSGTPASEALSDGVQAALVEGRILEVTDGDVRVTEWFASTSSAWQSILRGESGDLSACGDSTLDTWTADLVARLVANPGQASAIRRDLRRKGIAAFGMLG